MTRNRPPPRRGHTLSLLGTTVLVFGGFGGREIFNDLYALDLNKLQSHPDGASWETLIPHEYRMPQERHLDRPAARFNHTMVAWNHSLYL